MIFDKNKIIKLLNIIIWFVIFGYLIYKLRYACVIHDDIEDILLRTFYFIHGRFFTEFIETIFIKIIPEHLNIHYNDFAIISESGLKSFTFALLAYFCSLSFIIFKNKNTNFILIIPILFILMPFLLYSIMVKYDFVWTFLNSQYYFGYVGGFLLFLIFWYKLFDFYKSDNLISTRQFILLLILAIIAQTSNEQLNLVLIILLFLLIIEHLILIKKSDENNRKLYFNHLKILIILFFTMTIMSLIIYTKNVNADLYNMYIYNGNGINFKISAVTFNHFIFELKRMIFYKNIYVLLPLILNILFMLRNNNQEIKKVLKYTLYTMIGFTIFVVGTIILPADSYAVQEEVVYPFWFCAETMIVPFSFSIVIFYIFTSSVLIQIQKNEFSKYILCIFMILFLLINTVKYIKPFDDKSIGGVEYMRTMLYKMEKMSVFYFKQNKTAILPNDLPVFVHDDYSLESLKNINEDTILYNSTYEKYLRLVYRDLIPENLGIRFVDNEKAFLEYKKQGGNFTSDELKKQKFSQIRKDLFN